jgi:glycosyltransferase involved in cell wall biosynthesis
MRIIQLTPGTGGFFCGSCLRDQALVRALRRRGHDAIIVPMYLPHVLESAEPAPAAPLFFGGVNVYLQQKSALFRNAPRWLDRLLDSAAVLRFAARRAGMTRPDDDLGELTLSMLQGEQGHQTRELDKLLDWLVSQPRPDVVALSNVMLVGLARRIRQALHVPVVCTLQGEESFLDAMPGYRDRLWQTLAERCAEVDAFIAVSQWYGDAMQRRLSLPAGRVHVVHNGIDVSPFASLSPQPRGRTIGYLARMHPDKGLHTLIDAFVLLRGRGGFDDVALHIGGAMTARDEPVVRQQRDKLAAAGLDQAVQWHPNLDLAGKTRLLSSLSLFSVPATYGESFGLYVIEAWACGVPVVQPRHGGFTELLGASGGGILVAPDDPGALADAWAALLNDPTRAAELGRRGREAVLSRFTVEHMAAGVEATFRSVCTSNQQAEIPT